MAAALKRAKSRDFPGVSSELDSLVPSAGRGASDEGCSKPAWSLPNRARPLLLRSRHMLVQAVVLVASAFATPRPSSGAIATYLVPVDETVLGKDFSAAQVETTLRERLGRQAALRLVDELERGGMRVQVTGCARVEGSTVKREREPQPPVTLPHGRGTGTTKIIDEVFGASVEKRKLVVLSVRVVWQDEVRDLASGEADQTLEAAASTVARELEKLVKRKRSRSGP
jgi:hypothetical protein